MSLPREPRQKMINMMYLVLTALLALNVSSEILNAFKTVNNSLEKTNATVNNSTTTIMASLEDKKSDPTTAERAMIWHPKAERVIGYSKPIYDYIQGLKDRILREAGGDPNNKDKHFKEDNLDIATRIMVEKGEGKKLLDMLTKYKTDVMTVADSATKESFQNALQIDLNKPPTKNKGNNSWEAAYFRMVPTVAAMTILSKFQNDIKTTENRLVSICHEQVGKVTVRFDTYAAIVGQNSTYLMPGSDLEIKAGVGAFSKASLPVITIGGQVQTITDSGFVRYKTQVNTLGQGSVPVHIEYTDQEGKKQTIDTRVSYTVGQSNASIALDEMNVLYIGYDNKISVAASGAGDDKIQVSISGGGGSLQRVGGGKYVARVTSVTDDCKISISVDGKTAGASVFRVRTIPTPVATIGGVMSNENMTVGQLKAQTGVGAFIQNFPLNLKYTVTSFTLTADNEDGDIDEAACQGYQWSPKAQQMINNMKAGRMITVENIRATGPDGRNVKLPGLTYYIK
ncbi:MAG TPA: gliding motility protein GldM [Chitinophagaceae bacterium]